MLDITQQTKRRKQVTTFYNKWNVLLFWQATHFIVHWLEKNVQLHYSCFVSRNVFIHFSLQKKNSTKISSFFFFRNCGFFLFVTDVLLSFFYSKCKSVYAYTSFYSYPQNTSSHYISYAVFCTFIWRLAFFSMYCYCNCFAMCSPS